MKPTAAGAIDRKALLSLSLDVIEKRGGKRAIKMAKSGKFSPNFSGSDE
jgi:hypothetical protein